MIRIAGAGSFQISTTEQVYPHSTWEDGSTLYCKKVNMGGISPNTQLVVAHGINDLSLSKIYDLKVFGYTATTTVGVGYSPWYYSFIQLVNIVCYADGNQGAATIYAHVIYGKTI